MTFLKDIFNSKAFRKTILGLNFALGAGAVIAVVASNPLAGAAVAGTAMMSTSILGFERLKRQAKDDKPSENPPPGPGL